MALRYKALFCGSLITAIACSNPAEGMVVRPLCLLSDADVSASVKTHHWFRAVLLCVCVCVGGRVWFFLFYYIQHAPLLSNTTCFTVKYSQYNIMCGVCLCVVCVCVCVCVVSVVCVVGVCV